MEAADDLCKIECFTKIGSAGLFCEKTNSIYIGPAPALDDYKIPFDISPADHLTKEWKSIGIGTAALFSKYICDFENDAAGQ